MESNYGGVRSTELCQRNTSAVDADPSSAEIQVQAPIGAKLESLRETQGKTLATLAEMHENLVGPSPESGDGAKRLYSTFLNQMCDENNELAETILYLSRRILKVIGERKG